MASSLYPPHLREITSCAVTQTQTQVCLLPGFHLVFLVQSNKAMLVKKKKKNILTIPHCVSG